MQYFVKSSLVLTAILFAVACGDGGNKALEKKKAELEKLKGQISTLEEEIAKLDTAAAKAEKAKLVSITPVTAENFEHYISLQGIIDAEQISYVTPRGQGGQIRAIYVRQGDPVRKGQLLIKLDDAIARQNVTASEQQLVDVRRQIELSKDMLRRQENLWKEGIGTEVQLVNARNAVTQAENQLKALTENSKVSKEQLNTSNVYAEIDGVADKVTAKIGEFFSGNEQTGGVIRIVNINNLKVTAQVPENYIDKVHKGSILQVSLPDIGKNLTATVTAAGKMIDPLTRAFYVDAKIPSDKELRPNQVAMVKIQDYQAANAITVPLNTLQNDEKGKFVLVAVKEGNKLIARKKPVTVGELQDDKLEIRSGLTTSDVLITEGFQGLYDGQLITTQ